MTRGILAAALAADSACVILLLSAAFRDPPGAWLQLTLAAFLAAAAVGLVAKRRWGRWAHIAAALLVFSLAAGIVAPGSLLWAAFGYLWSLVLTALMLTRSMRGWTNARPVEREPPVQSRG